MPKNPVLREKQCDWAGVEDGVKGVLLRLLGGDLPWPLFLWGEAGTGKTCAALCVLEATGGLYFTASELAQDLALVKLGKKCWRDGERGGDYTEQTYYNMVRRHKVVVVDELGSKNAVSDNHFEAVLRVIEARHRRPLVLISNLPLRDLTSVYDDRVGDRITAGTVHKYPGGSRRKSAGVVTSK